MEKVVVTGGSGGAGRVTIRHLLEHGYETLSLDRAQPPDRLAPFRQVDLTDYGQTFAAMHGYEAVVHLAADPRPDQDLFTGANRFHNNTLSAYNVFNAAIRLGMRRIVWASSETVMGYPFVESKPISVPVTDDHPPQPQNDYALSKLVCEQVARHYNQLYGVPIIGLRLSNILHTEVPHRASYEAVPSYWDDAQKRRFNLWNYIDAEDVARAARLSLEADLTTAEVLLIGAADTIMNRPSRDLMAEVFPDVPVDRNLGEFASLVSGDKARRLIGFVPQVSWRDRIKER